MALKDFFVAPPMAPSSELRQRALDMGHRAGNFFLDLQKMPQGTDPRTVKQTAKNFARASKQATKLNAQANYGPFRRGVNRLRRSAIRSAFVGVPVVGSTLGALGTVLATAPAAASGAYNASVDRLSRWLNTSGVLGKKYTVTNEQLSQFEPRRTMPMRSRTPDSLDLKIVNKARVNDELLPIVPEKKLKDVPVIPEQFDRSGEYRTGF